MKESFEQTILRRDLLRLVITCTGLVLLGSQLSEPGLAKPVDLQNKRRVRYQPDSPEVRNFYRVNSYPAR